MEKKFHLLPLFKYRREIPISTDELGARRIITLEQNTLSIFSHYDKTYPKLLLRILRIVLRLNGVFLRGFWLVYHDSVHLMLCSASFLNLPGSLTVNTESAAPSSSTVWAGGTIHTVLGPSSLSQTEGGDTRHQEACQAAQQTGVTQTVCIITNLTARTQKTTTADTTVSTAVE